MTKMKGKKQEAPLNSEMNSEVIDIQCNFCSSVQQQVDCEGALWQSSIISSTNMTFPTSSPSRRQSMNVVYVYTEGCSPSMRSICCLSTRSLTSPLHCVREKKERLHETCEFCDFRCNDIKLSRAKTQMRVHMRCKYKCDVLTKARSLQTYGPSLRSSALILDNLRDHSLRLHGSIG